MTDEEEKPDYSVGFGRTPRETQFKPGRSGNPNGRPKGSKNFATILSDELKARVPIAERGKQRNITKRQVIAMQLVNKAASGDLKAITALLNSAHLQDELGGADRLAAPAAAEDQLVIEAFLRRHQQPDLPSMKHGPSSDRPTDPDAHTDITPRSKPKEAS